MAAPEITARLEPDGIMLEDGFSTTIAFARNPAVALWEKEVTPPGIEGGDAIDTTTMHNAKWRTKAPRQLMELTEVSFTAAFDPKMYTELQELINQNGSITVHEPDGSTVSFFGYLKSATRNAMSEGTHPELSCTIVPTNRDEDGVEQDPVVVEVSGT